jgi:hypothetical protein
MDSKIQNLIYKDINKVSLFFKNNISKYLISNTTFKYSKKLNILDAFVFDLLNTKAKSTKEISKTQLSYHKTVTFSRQAISKVSDKIKSNHYSDISKLLYNNFLVNYDTTDETVKIDGTLIKIYDKTAKLGYRSIYLLGAVKKIDMPVDLYINDSKNNDSETELFYQSIDKIEKNKTVVVDGLYFCNKFIDRCHNNTLNFVAKMKKNSLYLKKYKLHNSIEQNKQKINIQKYKKTEISNEEIKKINKENKKNKQIKNEISATNFNKNDYTVDYKNTELRIITFVHNKKVIHLCTDLLKKSYKEIMEDYKKRWDVEVYFKIIKNNTNIDHIKARNTEKINKQISSTFTASMLYNIILNIYKKHTKCTSGLKDPMRNPRFSWYCTSGLPDAQSKIFLVLYKIS